MNMQTNSQQTEGAVAVRSGDLFGTLRVLLTPSCWLQINPYCEAWEKELRRLMARHRFEPVDEYTAKLGDREIWIANHPYGSMRQYGNIPHVRPKRSTVLAAHRKLLDDLIVPNDQAHPTAAESDGGAGRKESNGK